MDNLRETIIKANPSRSNLNKKSIKNFGKDPTITDVLIAFRETLNKECSVVFTNKHVVDFIYKKWDLDNDSLSWHKENKPETIKYLTSLIT